MTESVVTLDLHGMNCFQARTAITSCLKKSSASVYQIRLIHGHHGGTALKDMIDLEFSTHAKVRRCLSPHPGETVLILREL